MQHALHLTLPATVACFSLTPSARAAKAALVRHQVAREVFDVKTKYTFTRAVSLYCDVENGFAEPINKNYFVYEDRPNQTRLTAPKVVFGVQGRF